MGCSECGKCCASKKAAEKPAKIEKKATAAKPKK